MIVAIVLDDGRADYLRQCVPTLTEHVAPIDTRILVNDTGEAGYGDWLGWTFKEFDEIVNHPKRLGLAGALRSAWTTALEYNPDYLFHVEGDFVFECDVDLGDMVRILDDNPTLAQVTLYRQPVNAEEVAIGGYMNTPGRYVQCDGYVKHSHLFSFNPCLIPADVARLCLAEPNDGLERGFTDTLLDFNFHFGIYGRIKDAPRIHHIGEKRSAEWRP